MLVQDSKSGCGACSRIRIRNKYVLGGDKYRVEQIFHKTVCAATVHRQEEDFVPALPVIDGLNFVATVRLNVHHHFGKRNIIWYI